MINKLKKEIIKSNLARFFKAKNLVVSLLLVGLVFSISSCSYNPAKSDKKTKKMQKILLDKKASLEDMDFPSHDPSIIKGKGVYAQNCAQCHGNKPNLNASYMRTRTPQEQYLFVTRGVDGKKHSFTSKLTREERWDALMYMRANILGYYPVAGAQLAELDSIFGGNCAVCHGTRGHGDGPLHKSLVPPPANFNDFSRLYTRSDDYLFDEISHGIAWTAMPAWKNRYDYDKGTYFDDNLRWKLVRYVRQFGFSQEVDRLDRGRENLEDYKESLKKEAK